MLFFVEYEERGREFRGGGSLQGRNIAAAGGDGSFPMEIKEVAGGCPVVAALGLSSFLWLENDRGRAKVMFDDQREL